MPARRAQMCLSPCHQTAILQCLQESENYGQPTATHAHSIRRKLGHAGGVQLALLDQPGVRHLCTITSSVPCPKSRTPSPWLCSVQHWCYWRPRHFHGECERNADFSYRLRGPSVLSIPMGRFFLKQGSLWALSTFRNTTLREINSLDKILKGGGVLNTLSFNSAQDFWRDVPCWMHHLVKTTTFKKGMWFL